METSYVQVLYFVTVLPSAEPGHDGAVVQPGGQLPGGGHVQGPQQLPTGGNTCHDLENNTCKVFNSFQQEVTLVMT